MKGQLWQHGVGLFCCPKSTLTAGPGEVEPPWSNTSHAR